jgi:hypothetical protein
VKYFLLVKEMQFYCQDTISESCRVGTENVALLYSRDILSESCPLGKGNSVVM